MRARPAIRRALPSLLGLTALASIAHAADGGVDGGAPLLPPSVGPEAAVSPPTYGSADVSYYDSGACGPDRCLLIWNGYVNPYAMIVDSDGNPVRRSALVLDGFAGIQSAVFIGGDFVAATSAGGDVTLARLAPDGSPVATNTVTVGAAVTDLNVAWNGTHLLVAYRDAVGADYGTFTIRFDANLAPLETPRLLETHAGSFAPLRVVGAGSEFAIVTGGTQARAWAITDAGQTRVGPVTLPMELSFGINQAVSANGTVVLLSSQGNLFRLGADLQVSASNPSGTLNGATLAWNGTSLLVAASDSTNGITTMRFGLNLGAQDPSYTRSGLAGAPMVFGRGGEFMLFGWRMGYSQDDYGINAMALNSGGRPRFTAGTLASIQALRQYNPLVVAQASGFEVVAGQGQFQMAILPVGTDGRPVAGRPAAGLPTYTIPRPITLGAGPNGGILFSGSAIEARIMEVRFDALGQSLDAYPTEFTTVSTQTRGSLVWNGASYLWLFGDTTRTVTADGTVSTMPKRLYDPSGVLQSTADGIGTTTLVAGADTYQASGGTGLQLRVIRLDQTGTAIDAVPADVGPLYTTLGTGIALAHDPAHYMVAWTRARLRRTAP